MHSSFLQAGSSCLLRSPFHSVSKLEISYRLFSDLSGQQQKPISVSIPHGEMYFNGDRRGNVQISFFLEGQHHSQFCSSSLLWAHLSCNLYTMVRWYLHQKSLKPAACGKGKSSSLSPCELHQEDGKFRRALSWCALVSLRDERLSMSVGAGRLFLSTTRPTSQCSLTSSLPRVGFSLSQLAGLCRAGINFLPVSPLHCRSCRIPSMPSGQSHHPWSISMARNVEIKQRRHSSQQ